MPATQDPNVAPKRSRDPYMASDVKNEGQGEPESDTKGVTTFSNTPEPRPRPRSTPPSSGFVAVNKFGGTSNAPLIVEGDSDSESESDMDDIPATLPGPVARALSASNTPSKNLPA